MRLYTRRGDDGETGLLGGQRVLKSSDVIEAIGDVDELNAWIGYVRTADDVAEQTIVDRVLHSIQNKLFSIGAALADPNVSNSRIADDDVTYIEGKIDLFTDKTPPIRHFILPTGTEGACRLHVARSVVRRAERALVRLNETQPIDSNILRYVNRLSDLFFVAARFINNERGETEEAWVAES